MSGNHSEFDEIYKTLINEIDDEVELERHIEERSKEIATQLYLSHSARVEINNAAYRMSYTIHDKETPGKHRKTKHIVLIAANETKFKLAGGKYMPFIADAEFNENLEVKENLEMIVESLVRKITGQFKIGADEL